MDTLVILNARAGTLLEMGAEGARDVVARAFADAGHPAEVVLAAPEDLEQLMRDAAHSHHDTVVIGGGDGSASHAMSMLSGTGKTLGILPLGTMNLLGTSLGIAGKSLEEMAQALARGERRMVDLATLNGQPFHTLCGLGFFSRVARERERARLSIPFGRAIGVGIATLRSLVTAGRMRLEIDAAGEQRVVDAYAVLVTNNRFGEDWRRTRLDEGVLEAHVLCDGPVLDRLAAGYEALAGRWREGQRIETITASSITIAAHRSRLWSSLDGELTRVNTPLKFRIQREKLPLLMPHVTD